MVVSFMRDSPSSSTQARPPAVYSPEQWDIDGEQAWNDWSAMPLMHYPATQQQQQQQPQQQQQQQPDTQRAWDGCIQEMHQCLSTMEVLLDSLEPPHKGSTNSSTLEGVISRLEQLRDWVDVSDAMLECPTFLPVFSPKDESPPPSRVSSPPPFPAFFPSLQTVKSSPSRTISSTTSSGTNSPTMTGAAMPVTTGNKSQRRSCEVVRRTAPPPPRRDTKRRKTATPADLRKTCEKQLLWTIMKLLKETAPEAFPFCKKDKTKLDDLRSALAVYDGPWGSMVTPQVVQERTAWKLKLGLSPFCRQLIDFLLEHKPSVNEGYREMILQMGFVRTAEAGMPQPLKHLLETDRWQGRRRTHFEIEVMTTPQKLTMALNSRFLPRTSLRSVLEEITRKVVGLPGFNIGMSDEVDAEDDMFIVIKIDGPPQRVFLLRGSGANWELSDHTQESMVQITGDHVVCQLMLERCDTTVLVFPSHDQAVAAVTSFGPSSAPEPYVSLLDDSPPQEQEDHSADEHMPATVVGTGRTLSPPPVASFYDIRRMGGINVPQGLSSSSSESLSTSSRGGGLLPLSHSNSSSLCMSSLAPISTFTNLMSFSSSSSSSSSPLHEEQPALQDMVLPQVSILPSLRIILPPVAPLCGNNHTSHYQPGSRGTFSPISFFTSSSPTGMADDDDELTD